MKNTISIIWNAFVLVLEILFISVILYVIFRMFTMSWMDEMKFKVAYNLGGVEGFINMWINDIKSTISNVIAMI